jgi:hypothetical protein
LRRVLVRWNRRLSQAAPGEVVHLFDDLHEGSTSHTRAAGTRKRRKGGKP